MSYRISVPEYQDISSIYCDLTEECANAVKTLYEQMADNTAACHYKPLMDFTNKICQFFYGDFRNHIYTHFSNWEDSRYSLDNLTRSIGAGEDAAAVGKSYMMRIKESLDNMFNSAGLDEMNIDTSEPNIDNDTILRNTEYIRTFLHSAEAATESALRRVQDSAEQNDAYIAIQGVVGTLGKSLIDSFNSMIRQVENGEGMFDQGAFRFVNEGQEDTGMVLEAADSVKFDSWGDI